MFMKCFERNDMFIDPRIKMMFYELNELCYFELNYKPRLGKITYNMINESERPGLSGGI